MSELTLRLLGLGHKHSSQWLKVFAKVTNRLVATYGRPTLGNFRDPVREIFYIVLSAKTTEMLYRRAHANLFRRYSTLEELARADLKELATVVKCAGLGNKRATQVRNIAQKLLSDFGPKASHALRRLEPSDAYGYLLGLPGVGPKSAFCIMAMSLDADVFAVDVNVRRVAVRLGALPKRLKHYEAQARLPRLVPDGKARDLHVALVVHGREVCRPRRPACGECVLLDLCRYGTRQVKNGMVKAND